MMRFELYKQPVPAPEAGGNADFQPYLDAFWVDGANLPLGSVLILPGGGYSHRADHEGDPVARVFNNLGYNAFVLQYRVAPYRYPAPLADAAAAVRLLRSHGAEWGVFPEQIAILGFSAGAHLAGSCGLAWERIPNNSGVSARPDAMILCYPVISLTAEFAHRSSGEFLFGPESTDAERSTLDLEKQVAPGAPPAFVWHTSDDGSVPVQNSLAFAQAMWAQNNICELHVYPRGRHGLGLAYGTKDISGWPAEAADFLEHSAGFTRAK